MQYKSISYFLLFVLFSIGTISAQQPAKKGDKKPSLFKADELSPSDYLFSIEKAGDVLDIAKNDGRLDGSVQFIFGEIKKTKENLDLIATNIETGDSNVRNQQMYKKVLLELQEDFKNYRNILNENDERIVKIRKNNRNIIKDTVFAKLIKDSILIKEFKPQLLVLRDKWKSTDSLLRSNIDTLNSWKKDITERKMIISKDLIIVNKRLDKSSVSLFGKEYQHLWNTETQSKNAKIKSYLQDKFNTELKAFGYYFHYSLGSVLGLLLLMGLMLWWTLFNLRYIKKAQRLETLHDFKFRYINNGTILPIAVIGLNIGISLNLYAPALYIEFLHLILLGVLTILFKNIWSGKAFRNWLLLVLLFTMFAFMDLFVEVSFIQRCVFILVNAACIRFGIAHIKIIKEEMYFKGFFRYANVIFIAFNILAIIFNVFGRVSLAHTLSLTAVIALTQIIALSVFLKIIIEIITLQIYTIRLRRGIDKIFDFQSLENNLKKPFMILAAYLWIIVIASNLNLSNILYTGISNVLTRKNTIGSFSFSIGSILLFLLIIWVAHILQKYVAYFFGEIDEENEETINKRQHSKLLITRLLLLIFGYLLAISASGVPMDKITIVLGALGVGVGLGLQSIVNNFVSGVILIFEKPIQIGDVIDVSSQSGRVKTIGLRTTKIDTNNGAEIIIPNGNLLSQNIVNWTYTNNTRLADLNFTLQGNISQEEIKEIVIRCLNTVPYISPEKEPQLFYSFLSDSKYNLKVQFWCNIYRTEQAISEAKIALYDGFKKQDVTFE